MSNFDRLRTRAVRTTSVTLALDPNDADRLREARTAVTQATARRDRLNGQAGATLDAANDAVTEAEDALAAIEAEAVTFTVRLHGVGPRRVEELMVEHKPTEAQRKRARQLNGGDPKAEPQFNEDTMPPAILAEAIECIEFSDDPENPITNLSVEQVTELWAARWSVGDRLLIFQSAMLLDQAPSNVEALGKG